MATRWGINCKKCHKAFEYADHVHKKALLHKGHSRPEYCEDCRVIVARRRKSRGSPHFPRTLLRMKFVKSTDTQHLICREDRKHVDMVAQHTFDMSQYGLEEKQIREVFAWFENPEHQVAIVVAPTGAGKSTAFPYCLAFPPEGLPQNLFTKSGPIVISQPRIDAASGIAKYQAKLVGGFTGRNGEIGIRHSESKETSSFNNILLYATEGTIKNWVFQDELAGIGTIIIDEAHERSCNIDTILMRLRDVMKEYPHLKIIVTSATINPQEFVDLFGVDVATSLELSGEERKFQVHQCFAAQDKLLPYDNVSALSRNIALHACAKVQDILWKIQDKKLPRGHILVFLPGVNSIEESIDITREFVRKHASIFGNVSAFPWYRNISEKQRRDAVADESPDKVLKIIFSTNIGETSITVSHLVHVVDSGLIHQSNWNTSSQKDVISAILHSKSGCRQRFGRVGRTSDGYAHCLYTQEQFELFPDDTVPEIQRSNMDDTVLRIQSVDGILTQDVSWMSPPQCGDMYQSFIQLSHQGLFDVKGDVTTRGETLMKFWEFEEYTSLIIAAVRCGCIIELASVLPVIMVGGIRDIVEWDVHWDGVQRRDKAYSHASLMKNCRDDIDFVLKIICLFHEMNEEEGREFALNNGIRYSAIENIRKYRDDVLSKLQASMRDIDLSNLRCPNIALADTVRLLLAYFLSVYRRAGTAHALSMDTYVYRESWWNGALNPYMCRVAFSQTHIQICETLEKNACEIDALSLHVGASRYTECLKNREVTDSMHGLGYESGRDISDQKAYDAFRQRFKVGSQVILHIIDKIICTIEEVSLLILQHKETGAIVYLEIRDVTFTASGSVILQFPVGMKMSVCIADFCDASRYIRAQYLSLAEKYAKTVYDGFARAGKTSLQRGKIIDIHANGTIVVKITLPITETNFLCTVVVYKKALFQPLIAYAIGDECMIEVFSPHENRVTVALPFMDELCVSGLANLLPKEVSLEGQSLTSLGTMRFETLQELQKLFGDIPEYNNVLEDLYRKSYRLSARKLLSVTWIELLKSEFSEGKVLHQMRVEKVVAAGIVVTLREHVSGFVRIQDIYGRIESDTLGNIVAEGDTVNVRVISVNDEGRISLSMKVLGNTNPYTKLSIQSIVSGQVTEVRDTYFFVRIAPLVIGMVSIGNIWGRLDTVASVVKVGDMVSACIVSINEERDEVSLSMKLAHTNPYQNLYEEQIILGVVTAVAEKYFMVRIGQNVIGFVSLRETYGFHDHASSLVDIGEEVRVKIVSIDEITDNVRLSMRIPVNNPLRRYRVDEEVAGKVIKILENVGWIVEISDGISGLAHVKNCERYVSNLENEADVGDVVDVQIVDIDFDTGKLALKLL